MIFLLIASTGTAAFLPIAPKLSAALGLSVLCGLTLAAIVNASGVDERAGEARRGDLHRAGASEARRSADAHRASALRLSLTVHRR